MFGATLMLASVIFAAYAGFGRFVWYIIPVLGAVGAVGYVLFKPATIHVDKRTAVLSILGQWITSSVVIAIFYGAGRLFAFWT